MPGITHLIAWSGRFTTRCSLSRIGAIKYSFANLIISSPISRMGHILYMCSSQRLPLSWHIMEKSSMHLAFAVPKIPGQIQCWSNGITNNVSRLVFVDFLLNGSTNAENVYKCRLPLQPWLCTEKLSSHTGGQYWECSNHGPISWAFALELRSHIV